MRKSIYICDRCGKEIKGEVHQVRTFVKNHDDDGFTESLDGLQSNHYCESCMLDIFDALYPPKKEEDVEKPRVKRKYTRKYPSTKEADPVVEDGIDLGKVGALQRAGWADVEIARDLKTTVEAIAKAERERHDR